MSEPDPTSDPTPEEIKSRTATVVRRLGYLIFMGGGLLIFIPMLVGVASGIKNDRIWDPVTQQPVQATDRQADCQGEARRLMMDAALYDRLRSSWDEPYRAWITRCQKQHPDLYDMLRDTRRELRRGSQQ